MRTAIILLIILAVVAIPGSIFPQRQSDPNGVVQYFRDHPQVARILDYLGVFNLYDSVWFFAVYFLLLVSLVGCIVPRSIRHIGALFSQPKPAPRTLHRQDFHTSRDIDFLNEDAGEKDLKAANAECMKHVVHTLRRRGYRVFAQEEAQGFSVSARCGYLRDTGNILFHLGILFLVVSLWAFSGFSWRGQRILIEGQSFATDLASFSSISPGRFFTHSLLPSFALSLNKLDVEYEKDKKGRLGKPIDYNAQVEVGRFGKARERGSIRVNHPLNIDNVDVYLLANGYAPTVVVRDPSGKVVFRDHIVFVPQDAALTSTGVIKVPDGLTRQVGISATFCPQGAGHGPFSCVSRGPSLNSPVMILEVFVGDLGLNTGPPQSVYFLDVDNLTKIAGAGAQHKSIILRPGQVAEIPGGLGSIELESSVLRYASFDFHKDYTKIPAAIFAFLITLGIILSIAMPSRDVWVRLRASKGSAKLQIAGAAHNHSLGMAKLINKVCQQEADFISKKIKSIKG